MAITELDVAQPGIGMLPVLQEGRPENLQQYCKFMHELVWPVPEGR